NRSTSLLRTQTSMLHPLAHPWQIDSVADISHTLALNLKSLLVNAPTGQISVTFIEYGLSSSSPGYVTIVTLSPRLTNVSSESFAISSQKRMQREQEIHLSPSNITLGPSGTRLSL